MKCAVTEAKNIIDVGDAAVFQVKIWNSGTKEATHLLVNAELSENLKPISTDIESNEQARFEPKRRLLVFPPIERLGPGKEMIISIKVEATKPGQAVCRVNLAHDENSVAEKVDSMAAFRVTPSADGGSNSSRASLVKEYRNQLPRRTGAPARLRTVNREQIVSPPLGSMHSSPTIIPLASSGLTPRDIRPGLYRRGNPTDDHGLRYWLKKDSTAET